MFSSLTKVSLPIMTSFWRRLPVRSVRLYSVKQTTGITGLDVVPDGRNVAISECNLLLKDVSQIPEHAEYRKQVEVSVNYRLNLLSSSRSIDDIEKDLSMQIEELIQELKVERTLVPRMLEWRAWEKPSGDDLKI